MKLPLSPPTTQVPPQAKTKPARPRTLGPPSQNQLKCYWLGWLGLKCYWLGWLAWFKILLALGGGVVGGKG